MAHKQVKKCKLEEGGDDKDVNADTSAGGDVLSILSGDEQTEVNSSDNDDDKNCNQDAQLEEQSGEDVKVIERERAQLLQIFPEEIWMQILKNVEDPSDKENITNASLFFRNLLLPDRPLFLFPKVWGLLGEKYEKSLFVASCFPAYIASPTDFESFLEKNGRQCEVCRRWRLTKCFSGILKLREICRDWSSAVDTFYQIRPYYHYKLEVDPHDNIENKYDWTVDRFGEHSREYLDQFLEHFDRFHVAGAVVQRSPFLGRAINLMYDQGENEEALEHARQFWNGISNLLLKYGQHVWYCTIHIQDRHLRRVPYYPKLCEWLQQMPNLKVLDIRYRYSGGGEQDDSHLPADELVQLEEQVRSTPVPKLDSLQCLKTSHLPTPIFNQLILHNPHVSMLQLNREGVHEDYDIYTVPLPSLGQLSIKYDSETDFQKLQGLQVNWPLNKLYLNLDDCAFFPWSQIFHLLEHKWGHTLSHLVLNLPRTERISEEHRILKECPSLTLNLPLVKHLKLTMGNVSSLDFLLPLKESLELFEVTVKCDMDLWQSNSLYQSVMEGQVVEFLGFSGNLLESNIWKHFSKLRSIVFLGKVNQGMERRTHTRLDWQVELNKSAMKMCKLTD